MYDIGQFIDGSHTLSKTAENLTIINPALDEQIGHVQMASSDQVEKAIESAQTAFSNWQATSPLRRARILFNFKMLIEQNTEQLAKLITQEHGKTIEDAKGEIGRCIEVVEHNCGIASQLKGDYSDSVARDIDTYTMRQALGVCAGVSPFNFPVMVPTWMMVPAIACGNTFIIKPSEQTPAATMRLVELFHQAGLPNGVITLLNGDKRVVDILLKDQRIKTMTAVASTPVAEYIYQESSKNGKRSHTFGGAKNHCIVMPDANIEQTAKAIAGAAFGAAGERCMALSVAVVVGDKTADQLIHALQQEMASIKVGAGNEVDSDMGPLINKNHMTKVCDYIAHGIEEGATIIKDGRNIYPDKKGYFVGPTLFDNVTEPMKVYQEEIFGPVLCVVRMKSFEEAISLINRHQFGNGTAIFTNDGYAARTFAHQIQVGMVGINIPIPVPVAYHPFGGWKRSVFGDTNMHGRESIHFYTKLKTITSKWVKTTNTESTFVMPNLGDE